MNEERLVQPGNKFALLAIGCPTKNLPSCLSFAPGVIATTRPPIEFGDHWREWLGTVGYQDFRKFRLFLVVSVESGSPVTVGDENKTLHDRLRHWLVGLLLAGRASFGRPFFLAGAGGSPKPSIRQFGWWQPATEILGIGSPSIQRSTLESAWMIAQQIDALNTAGPGWRMTSVLTIFVEARARPGLLDRIHQFCRCIEGFILPDPGNTARQFKSRTELFIGPRNHDVMGQIYYVRSAVEHLHHQRLTEPTGRTERVELARQAAILEAVARGCITRLLSRPCLWPYFRTDNAILEFWSLTDAKRRELWGSATPIPDLIADFHEQLIANLELGLP
jgi:hypothetical protein